MGADIVDRPGSVKVTASRLAGAHVHLPFPSVGATENLLLAAVLAKGTTVISNAAVEPEIVDLVLMLQKMGALITIDTDRTLTISGVHELRGVEHHTVTDRIEIASFAAAAVATDGRIEVRGARQDHLITFLNALRHIGGEFTETEHGLEFFRARPLTATDIETGVHPGFMTDWQQPITVLLTQATGTSVVHETIYEDRFGYARQLKGSMGADIELTTRCLGATSCRWHNRDFQHTAKISGPTQLKAADLVIPDLRAGFGYVLAALVADGTSTISGTRYLERGYEQPVAKLTAVGARITTQPA
jgi:UDP-N-acetylglucosamine 1-carboxyvinyltransferase